MTENNFYSNNTTDSFLEECGIPTVNTLQGILMSIESNGYKDDRLETAYKDWEYYYDNPVATNFNCIICHLICKADAENLYRLSKGFPEHVRVFIEMQLLKDVPEEKLAELDGETGRTINE